MSKNEVSLITMPQDYFRSSLREAQKSLQFQFEEDVEFYITNLLCEFIDPSKLYEVLGGDNPMDTPLAFILQKALESEYEQQLQLYKLLGDTSLYVSGYFQDYFNRRTFDVSYYINMGITAYDTLHSIVKEKNIYGRLSTSFNKLVDILAEVASSNGITDNKNILALYDRWTHTNSDRLYKILQRLGIEPVPSNLKIAQ